jgi:hypothetical protein
MKPRHYLFCAIALIFALELSAQTPSYREVLDGLAKAEINDPIALPAAFFQHAENTALGKLQRGIVLYAAAGRARECNNPDRVSMLMAGAKSCLLYANEHLLASQSAQKSQCLYYLGLIAEKQEGNQAAAASYYEQAGNLSDNPGANNAGGRIQHAQAR